jgi:hypothetical protein
MTEWILAVCAVLALIVSIIALAVSLRIANGDFKARIEQFQFSWTPLVAVEGGNLGGAGATRKLDATVHLEGRGFVHNLILTLFLDEETAETAKIAPVWNFKRAPATEPVMFAYQVKTTGPNQSARIVGTFQNVFRQQISFTQRGTLRASTFQLDLTSGAPEYSWP